MIAEIAPKRPIAADLLLGAERTRGAQVLKQADVLMLHHLVPDEVAPGSLLPNVDYYEPRTSHGSSLSPAIHAAVLARAGRYRDALESLRLAARLDLDDLTATTAGGVHLATMVVSGRRWRSASRACVPTEHGSSSSRTCREAERARARPAPPGQPFRLRIDHAGVSVDQDELIARRTDGHWE